MAALRESAPMPSRAIAIYTRVSTPGQKNTTSLPEQERLCREYCAARGWPIHPAYIYREVEGGEDLYRPQMDRLWDAIQAGQVGAVVIDVLDRLSRDEGDQGAFYHHADRYGASVEVASEDIDESEHGRNLRSLAGIMSRMERSDIRRRTQRGRKARVAKGQMLPGAYPLYGYLWKDPEKSAYIPDPETAPIVVRLYEAIAAGVPLRKLAALLESEGVPTPGHILASRGQWPTEKRDEQGTIIRKARPYSTRWRRSTIRRMLWHPAYVGEHAAYRWQQDKHKERSPGTGITRKIIRVRERAEDAPERVKLPNACPPLVSLALAEAARARLTDHRAEAARHNVTPEVALVRTGIGVCGYCGGWLYVGKTTSPSVAHRYYCRSHPCAADPGGTPCPGGAFTMATHVLDACVWRDVLMWLEDEENVRRLLADWEAEGATAERSATSHLDAADAQLAALRRKMATLAETIADTPDRDSRAVLQAKLDEYTAQVRRETAKRDRLMREAAEVADHAAQAATVRDWVRVVTAQAARFTYDEKRQTLKALGAEVKVWREDYVNPDGKPGRYRVILHFTGFNAGTVTLPARTHSDSNILRLGPTSSATTTGAAPTGS